MPMVRRTSSHSWVEKPKMGKILYSTHSYRKLLGKRPPKKDNGSANSADMGFDSSSGDAKSPPTGFSNFNI